MSVGYLRPTEKGAVFQAGSPNIWTAVDEETVDYSNYIRYGVTGGTATDVFKLSPPEFYGTINSVKVHVCANKYGSETNTLKICIYIGGNCYYSDEIALTTSAVDYNRTWSTNPSTGTAWTYADILDLQAGFWVYTYVAGGYTNIFQVYVEVDYSAIGTFQSVILRPNADGDLTELIRNAGSHNYEAVDDVTPDEDTTYVRGLHTQEFESDLYNLPTSSVHNILWVKSVARARPLNTDYSTIAMRPLIKTHSVVYYNRSEDLRYYGTATYNNFISVWRINPYTGSA